MANSSSYMYLIGTNRARFEKSQRLNAELFRACAFFIALILGACKGNIENEPVRTEQTVNTALLDSTLTAVSNTRLHHHFPEELQSIATEPDRYKNWSSSALILGVAYHLNNMSYEHSGAMLELLHENPLPISHERHVKQLTAKQYYFTENYNPALDAFLAAARLDSSSKDTNAWAQTLCNVSSTYHSLFDFEGGLDYAEQAYNLIGHITDSATRFRVLQRYSSALVMMGSLDLALEINRRLSSMTNDPEELLYLKFDEAVVLDHQGQHDLAIDIFKDLLITAREQGDSASVAELFYNLSYSNYYNEEYDEAFFYMERFRFTQRNLEALQHSEDLKELEVRYETLKKEQEIAELNRAGERKDTILYRSVAGAIALLSIAILIIRNLRLKTISERKLREEENKSFEKSREIIALNASLQGIEEERRRIAMELHDGIGVLGSTILLKLSGLKKAVDDEKMQQRLDDGLDMLKDLNAEVRNVSHALMPSSLSKLGLNNAIEELLDHVRASTSIKIKYSFSLSKAAEDVDFQVTVYRIVQELINNTIKYSEANEIMLNLSEKDGWITLRYEDKGKGCTIEELKSGGNGYHSISSRVHFYQGTINVRCAPGQGIAYQITLSNETVELPVGG